MQIQHYSRQGINNVRVNLSSGTGISGFNQCMAVTPITIRAIYINQIVFYFRFIDRILHRTRIAMVTYNFARNTLLM